MFPSARTSTLLVLSTLLGVFVAAAPANAQDSSFSVAYRGEIIDDAGVPISGVFPLTFKLYRSAEGRSGFWSEEAFVAVSEGVYDVVLGDTEPIPREHANTTVFIAVEMGEIGEIARHSIVLTPLTGPRTRDEIIAELDVTFADLADRSLVAFEAETAGDCERLGGKTLSELDRYDEVLEEMAELRDRLDEVSGARLGSRTTTLERIGGSGGNSYSRSCPPGHVVTGARGGAGALIDSIELICSPLQ